MSYIPSRKFCCCLPVRAGVFVMAALGFVFGGFFAIAGIVQLSRIHSPTTTQKGIYGIQIAIYALLAFMSFLAIIGAAGKKRKLIRAFFVYLCIQTVLAVISGVLSLYTYFHNTKSNVNQCINGSTDAMVIAGCKQTIKVTKGVAVGLFIVLCLIQIWGCAIVNDYSKQLAEEEAVARKDATYLHA